MRLIGLRGISLGLGIISGLVLTPTAARAQSITAAQSSASQPADAAAQSAKVTALIRDFAFAPPEASMVGGLRLGNILKSELVAAGIAEAAKSKPEQAAMIGMGMGVLSEIKEVRFAIVDKTPADKAPVDKTMAKNAKPVAATSASDVLNQADVVMLISGKIDDGLLTMLTSAQSAATKDPGAKPSIPSIAFRRVDAETVLVGTAPLLTDAIERINRSRDGAIAAGKSNILESRAMAQRAALQDDHDFWLSGRIPDVPMTAGVGGSIKAFAMGLSLPAAGTQDVASIEMAAEAGSELMADSFLKMIRDGIAQQKEWAGLVETSTDHATIRLRAKLPNDLAMAAASGAMSLGGTPTAAAGITPRPAPLIPAEPQRKTVRIIGLEEGQREVPLR